tara:strand:- start:6106 stop:6594 length:489 start_codon:yes stop_codon:yes gene_type:complete
MREIKVGDKYLCKANDYDDGYFTSGNIYEVKEVFENGVGFLTDNKRAYTIWAQFLQKDFTDLQEEKIIHNEKEIQSIIKEYGIKTYNLNEYDFVNPEHYKKGNKEVIDMMLDIWGVEKLIAHCEMCAFKYRMRIGEKPNQPIEQDLKKANWYENKAKELKNN